MDQKEVRLALVTRNASSTILKLMRARTVLKDFTMEKTRDRRSTPKFANDLKKIHYRVCFGPVVEGPCCRKLGF